MPGHDSPCDFARNNRDLVSNHIKKGEVQFAAFDVRLRTIESQIIETKVMTEIMFRKFMDEKSIRFFDTNRNPKINNNKILESFNEESKKRQTLIKNLIKLVGIVTGIALAIAGCLAITGI